jgi:hypothetical protein
LGLKLLKASYLHSVKKPSSEKGKKERREPKPELLRA